MDSFLAFDVGTTSMKCILYNEDFKELFKKEHEYDINTPSPGIAEADPDIYYDTFLKCISDMKAESINTEDIKSITFTTQGETLIPVDKSGIPLSNAVVWLDCRAEDEMEFIKSRIPFGEFYKKTGLCETDGALPMAKILWFKRHKPDIYKKIYKFLLLEDYLIFRLTGRFCSEMSLQSSTGWYDIIGEKLYSEVFECCEVDKSLIPEVLCCGCEAGRISREVSDKTGLSQNTAVVTGAMDQIASAIGTGNIKEGIVSETTGTALVAGATVNTPRFDEASPITVYKHYNKSFIYMPYKNTAGITLKWFRDTVVPYAAEEAKKRGISSYAVIDEMAAKASPGSNGVIMNADLSAGGAFYGLSLSTTVSDLARSVLEGVCYMLRALVEDIEKKGIKIDRIYSVGGGSGSRLWNSIKADVLGKITEAGGYPQTTALGAAILGACGTGKYESVSDALKRVTRGAKEYIPNKDNTLLYDGLYKKYMGNEG